MSVVRCLEEFDRYFSVILAAMLGAYYTCVGTSGFINALFFNEFCRVASAVAFFKARLF